MRSTFLILIEYYNKEIAKLKIITIDIFKILNVEKNVNCEIIKLKIIN